MDAAGAAGKTRVASRGGARSVRIVLVALVWLLIGRLDGAAVAGLTGTGSGPAGQVRFGPARVNVDIFLAGELRDGLHDLVGYGPQQHAVGLLAVVAGEVERLAEPDARAVPRIGPDRRGRLELERVDHRARHDWRAGLDGQPGDAGLAPVQTAVRAPGALRVDAEHMAGRQHLQPGSDGLLARRPAGPVDR